MNVNEEKKLTIFTPTFNRGYILQQLYNSLLIQTCDCFKWLIVDDGSTDNTRELVETWIKEEKISINYIYQANAGKMQAHNKGVDNTDTELFVCVDSDDYLVEDAVEEIINTYRKIDNDDKLIGIVGYRGITKEEMLGKNSFPHEYSSSLRKIYEHGFRGDTTLVYKTKLLKKFRFPFIQDEKFLSEGYLYDQIDQYYKYYIFPKIFIVCNYKNDGYTLNMDEILFKNPKGTLLVFNQRMGMQFSFKTRIIAAANYQYYSWIFHNENYVQNATNKLMLLLSLPISCYLYFKNKKSM